MTMRLTREQALNSVTENLAEWPKVRPEVSSTYGWHWTRCASGTVLLEPTSGAAPLTMSDWAESRKVRRFQQLADVSRERDVLAEALRQVISATGTIDAERLYAGADLVIASDIAIEWIDSAKRVL